MTSRRTALRTDATSFVPATLGSLAVHTVGLLSLAWLTAFTGLLAALFPFCARPDPPVHETIEVSMVALPKWQRNVPDRLARTARSTGTEAPTREPPPIRQSDLAIQVPDAAPQPGNTEHALREQMLTEIERNRLLEQVMDAPDGTVDRNRTDPNGQEDLDLAVLGAGATGDPALLRWMAQVQQVLMPNFRPLTHGRTDLECVVSIEMDPATGDILGWKVVSPSGSASYDAAAERAVADTRTLPLPPEKYLPLIAEGVGFRFTPP